MLNTKSANEQILEWIKYDNTFYALYARFDDGIRKLTWYDGSPMTYPNWKSTNPPPSTTPICTVVNAEDGYWYDYGCNMQFSVLCEKDAVSDEGSGGGDVINNTKDLMKKLLVDIDANMKVLTDTNDTDVEYVLGVKTELETRTK
ncbi:hypothetical protein B4U80_12481 [Leptotrombidium deliense]|uniref:C-type lectin domain-containing protein n=1 Tax=Leptotrombidium deliense TaxID=299467 RepID=A0A443RT67_9ACAR|nr:hypothetical protein B4U80_12481 [Leptotrombidium deliense]